MTCSLALGLILLATMPPLAGAKGIIDQSYTPFTSNWRWVRTNMPIGQSFTPSKNTLLGVDVGIDNTVTSDASLTVNIRADSIDGRILGTATATVPITTFTLFHVDFTTPISLTLGKQYVIELEQSVQSVRWYIVEPGGAYVGGSAITGGTVNPDGDYIFNTYAPVALTPTSLSIILTPSTVDIGQSPPGTGTITASIHPVLVGAAISIWYSNSSVGPWILISIGPAGATGTYTVIWSPLATGTYYFRADFAGDSTYAASSTISAPNSINVVPEFPLTAIVLAFVVGMSQVLLSRRKKKLGCHGRWC